MQLKMVVFDSSPAVLLIEFVWIRAAKVLLQGIFSFRKGNLSNLKNYYFVNWRKFHIFASRYNQNQIIK